MKFIVGSDIHGSIYYASLFKEKIEEYKPDKIILLGDLYYNGARNDPPKDYAPKKVVELLNSYADSILAVKGNCESHVDQTVSSFIINDSLSIFAFNKTIFCTHGHIFSFDEHPHNFGDIFLQGHTHISKLFKKDNKIFANPGSISIPKDDHHSYMTISEEGIKIIDLLTGEILNSLNF